MGVVNIRGWKDDRLMEVKGGNHEAEVHYISYRLEERRGRHRNVRSRQRRDDTLSKMDS